MEAVIIVALVLLVLVAVFTLAIVLSNPDVYELSLFRVLIPVTSAGVYLTGVGAAVLILVALAMLRAGLRRRRVRRLEQKSAATAPAAERRPPSSDRGRPGPDPRRPRAGPRRSTWIVRRPRPAERQALLDEVDRVSPDDAAK